MSAESYDDIEAGLDGLLDSTKAGAATNATGGERRDCSRSADNGQDRSGNIGVVAWKPEVDQSLARASRSTDNLTPCQTLEVISSCSSASMASARACHTFGIIKGGLGRLNPRQEVERFVPSTRYALGA